jgi:hypothetical protein
MAEIEIEIAGRRAVLDIAPEEAGRARALARRLESVAADFADEPDRAAFFARLALVLAAEIDEATARIEALSRALREGDGG